MEEYVIESYVPISFMYNNRVGRYLQNYLDGLKEKKILGSKCSGCGRVVVPPRSACGRCGGKMDELVELPQEGVVELFTIAHVAVEGPEFKKLDSPQIIALVKIEGCDALLSTVLLNVKAENVKKGMKVKAVWKDETTGDYDDLKGFEPL